MWILFTASITYQEFERLCQNTKQWQYSRRSMGNGEVAEQEGKYYIETESSSSEFKDNKHIEL